jgi:shikimate kinase
MHSRIYLIGFMGSGKTTQGKKIARMMGYDFIDMDIWIEEKEDLKVTEIFEQKGEAYFRKKETETIQELRNREKVVISTGGGAPCYGDNMKLLNESGLTIYLKLSPGVLQNRLKNSHVERPLVAGKSEDELRQTIEEMLSERELFYMQAEMVIDALGEVNERIVNAIQRR